MSAVQSAGPLPAWFQDYLALGADRPGLLKSVLQDAGIKVRAVELSGGLHLVATPPSMVRSEACRYKIITAHHDRVAGTPGALDNSAANLQLVRFLVSAQAAVNTAVIFTDHEELSGTVIDRQGSYILGTALQRLGYQAPMVFSLDVTGRGDTLLLSSASDSLAGRDASFRGLALQVDDTANQLRRLLGTRVPVRQARVPFGEDLGFLCAGVASLVLTVLPRREYEGLTGQAFDGGAYGDNNSPGAPGGAAPALLPPWASLRAPGIPETWRYLHGAQDTPKLYTAEAFSLMARVLQCLAEWRLPAYIG